MFSRLQLEQFGFCALEHIRLRAPRGPRVVQNRKLLAQHWNKLLGTRPVRPLGGWQAERIKTITASCGPYVSYVPFRYYASYRTPFFVQA